MPWVKISGMINMIVDTPFGISNQGLDPFQNSRNNILAHQNALPSVVTEVFLCRMLTVNCFSQIFRNAINSNFRIKFMIWAKYKKLRHKTHLGR